jgi:hypothetical protein
LATLLDAPTAMVVLIPYPGGSAGTFYRRNDSRLAVLHRKTPDIRQRSERHRNVVKSRIHCRNNIQFLNVWIWPVTSFAARPQYIWSWGQSGLVWRALNTSLMTLTGPDRGWLQRRG